jgi:hypothetical protein
MVTMVALVVVELLLAQRSVRAVLVILQTLLHPKEITAV